jgi:hypothetical protein
MNIFGIENLSNLILKQALLKDIELAYALVNKTTEDEIESTVNEKLQEFYENVGKPFFKPILFNAGSYPAIEHYNKNCSSIYNDIALISSELENLTTQIVDHFNYRQVKEKNIENKINYLASLCSDYVLSSNITENNIAYINENFNNTEGIDTNVTMNEARAFVDIRHGTLTLKRTDSIDRSIGATVSSLTGNGEAGNYHLVKSDKDIKAFLSNYGSHDDIKVILDGNPDTWFEYQFINLGNQAKSWKSDKSWVKSDEDKLTLNIYIVLKEAEDINWINLNPYLPDSNSKLTVKLISTSEDGANYQDLYANNLYLNAELNSTAQTYRAEDIVSEAYNVPNKFTGQGVWTFGSRKAKYIRIVLEQSKTYQTEVGHVKYTKIINNTDGSIKSQLLLADSEVTSDIKNGELKQYKGNDANEYIKKEIEAATGARYCIGIKDVGINSYKYASRSEIVTVPYEYAKPIKEVSLYAKEYIPNSFLADFTKINSWITYEISLDGSTFYPISPMHRNPVGSGELKTASGASTIFPPKIYEINPANSYEVQQQLFYKGYITTTKPPKKIQLKITLIRPEAIIDETPVLDNFILKIRTEEG